MPRLRTVSATDPGWRRRRCGKGFSYVDEHGNRLCDEDVARVRSLVIPPAWQDVWICPHPRGHLQAVGTDVAGRRQYIYHPDWRLQRDAEKFDRVLELGRRLPRLRRTLLEQLEGPPTERQTVVAAAIRMIDLGCFRVGTDEYLEENGSYGLTTLEVRHVQRSPECLTFAYTAKSGVDQEVCVADPDVRRVIDAVTRTRKGSARLLCAKELGRWRPVAPEELNQRIRELTGVDATAKDFRTWHATVLAAELLASVERASSVTRRKRQVKAMYDEVAGMLGNTTAVARASYVDPRVVDKFEDGETIALPRRTTDPRRRQDRLDRAVVGLLS
ncbi:MAG TPA: DNA topoisomerase IB [Marmoricola sp.]|nr:DNA topoisomerase IB [Marmoricola sp.]